MEDLTFVKIFRKMTEWEWYTDPLTAHLFIHLILKANYTNKSWRGIDIKRGEYIASLKRLSNETGISIQSVRTSLSRLEKSKDIEIKSIYPTHKHTHVRICNYETYQRKIDVDNTLLTHVQHVSNATPTQPQHISNASLTLTKEGIESKESIEGEESKESSVVVAGKNELTNTKEFFDECLKIWNKYLAEHDSEIKKLTEARIRALSERMMSFASNDTLALQIFEKLCLKIAQSDYLNGKKRGGKSADWDWVMESDETWVKILEGKYDDIEPSNPTSAARFTPQVERESKHESKASELKVLSELPSLIKIKN